MKAVRVAANGNYNNRYGTFPHKASGMPLWLLFVHLRWLLFVHL